MVAGFDELIAFLLDEISFCGTRGIAAVDLGNLVTAFYQNNDNAATTLNSNRETYRADGRLVEKVWRWLADHPDILVGSNREWNHLSLAEFEQIEHRHANKSADNADDASNQTRIFTTEDRMWQAVAGHSSDSKLIPPMEFQALCIIASFREAGILQPELVQLTGQDKRSLPKRTDVLADRGYIEKVPIFVRKHKTSLLRHKRYAKIPSNVWSASGVRSSPFNGSRFDLDSFVNILLEKFGDVGITTMQDLYVAVGVESRDVWKQRTTRRTLDVLQILGLISRFRAPCGIPTKETRYIPCIKLLRPPTDDDRTRAFSDRKQKACETAEHNASELSGTPGAVGIETSLPFVENNGVINVITQDEEDQDDDQSFDNGEETYPSSWDPDVPCVNAIHRAVFDAGFEGIGSTELRTRIFGTTYLRPVENLLGNLTDTWELSQPPHLRHLAIIRDSSLVERNAQYHYHTYVGFQEAVNKGSLTWEAVLSKQKEPSKLSRPSLDSWGFVETNKNQLHNRNGSSTLSEIMSTVKVPKQALMSREPRLLGNVDGKQKVDFERVSTAPADSNKANTDEKLIKSKRKAKQTRRRVFRTQNADDVPMIGGIPATEYRKQYQAVYQEKKQAQKRLPQIQRYAKWVATQEAVADFIAKANHGQIEDIILPDPDVQVLLAQRGAKAQASRSQIAQTSRPVESEQHQGVNQLIKAASTDHNSRNEAPGASIQDPPFATRSSRKTSAISLRNTPRDTIEISYSSSGRQGQEDLGLPQSRTEGRPSRKRKTTERGAELQHALTSKRRKHRKSLLSPASAARQPADSEVKTASYEDSPVTNRQLDNPVATTELPVPTTRQVSVWMKPVTASSARIRELIPILADTSRPGVHIQPVGSKPACGPGRGSKNFLIVAFRFSWLKDLDWFTDNHISDSRSSAGREVATKINDYRATDDETSSGVRGTIKPHVDKDYSFDSTQSVEELQRLPSPVSAQGRQRQDSENLELEDHTTSVTATLHVDSEKVVQNHTRPERPVGAYRIRKRGRQRANQKALALKFVLPPEKLRRILNGRDESPTGSNADIASAKSNTSIISVAATAETDGATNSNLQVSMTVQESIKETQPSIEGLSNIVQGILASKPANHTTIARNPAQEYHDRYERTPSNYADWNVRAIAKRERVTSRKKGIQLGGGSSRFRKTQIVMEIIDSCQGVIGGDNEIVRPYRVLYSKKYGSKQMPDRDTVAKAVKNVADQGKLKRVAFIFAHSDGTTITRHLLMRSDISFDSAVAQAMVENIKRAHPRQYIPAHLDVGDVSWQKGPEPRFKTIDESIRVVPQQSINDAAAAVAQAEAEAQEPSLPPAPWEAHFASKRKELAAARDAAFEQEQILQKRAWGDDSADPQAKRPQIIYSAKAFASSNLLQRHLRNQRHLRTSTKDKQTNRNRLEAAADRVRDRMEVEEAAVPGRTVFSNEMTTVTTTPWKTAHRTAMVESDPITRVQRQKNLQSSLVGASGVADHDDGGTNKFCGFIRANAAPRTVQNMIKTFRNRFTRPAQAFQASTGTFSSPFTTAHWTWQYYHDTRIAFLDKHNSSVPQQPSKLISHYHSIDDRSQSQSENMEITASRLAEPLVEIEAEVDSWYDHGYRMRVQTTSDLTFVNYSLNHNHDVPSWNGHDFRNMARKFTNYSFNPREAATHFGDSLHRPYSVAAGGLGAFQVSRPAKEIELNATKPKPSPIARKTLVAPVKFKETATTARAVVPERKPAVSKTTSRHHPAKQDSRCVIDVETSRILLLSVVVVRTLAGGLDRTIRWKVIDELFSSHPHYCQINFKNRWQQMSKSRPDVVDKLQDEFEDAFLNAYDEGMLPTFDFASPEAYDWQGIIDWTVQSIDIVEDVDEVAMTDVVDNKYYIHTKPSASEFLREDYLRPISTTIRRTYAMNVIPTSLPLRHVRNAGDMLLARSWVRSAVEEGDRINTDTAAAFRLQSLNETLLRGSIEALLNDRIIQSKTKRFGPFMRLDQLPLLASVRLYQDGTFSEAVFFKDALDEAFMSGKSSVPISQAITSSQSLALSEMLLHGRVVTRAIMPEIDNNVTGNQPRLSVWGLNDGGYQSRKIDTDAMFWPLSILPSATYEYGRPIQNIVCQSTIPLRSPEDDISRARIPYWVTFNGKLRIDRWRLVVLVVVQSLAQKAGISAATLSSLLKGSLDLWELELALQWLEGVGAARRLCDAWYAAEWWWMVLPCLSYLDSEEQEFANQARAER